MADRSRAEMAVLQQRMEEVFPAVYARLIAIPGVMAIGTGIKETAARLTGEPAFTVTVLEKKPLDEVSPAEMVPAEIAGFPTDVQVFRPGEPEDDTSKYRPVTGGIQIERAGGGALSIGTLGCLATLDADDTVVLLTAGHIAGIPRDDTPAGLAGGNNGGVEFGQPTYSTSCCCKCNDIAVTLHGVLHLHLDFAIARLESGVQHEATIHEAGAITAVGVAMMGDPVHKRGRSTGHTQGMITNLTRNGAGVVEAIEVKKNAGNDRFSSGGDSGAALLNDDNEIIGLHFFGNNGPTVTAPHFFSRSVPIQLVLSTLAAHNFAITILTGDEGESVDLRSTAEIAQSDMLWAAELRLRRSDAGRELWGLVERHQNEILHLVNHTRAGTVVWQRNQGPSFIAALGRSMKEPIYRIPREIAGVSRAQLAEALATMLDAHGSDALRADLAQHRAVLRDLLVESDSAEEMFQRWEKSAHHELAFTSES